MPAACRVAKMISCCIDCATNCKCKIHLIHRLTAPPAAACCWPSMLRTASACGQDLHEPRVHKDYLAVCRGWPESRFTVDYALDGGPGKPEKKPAITEFNRLATAELAMPSAAHESSRYALMQCAPVTGRFRQIRRHLKHVSHHLIGDTSHGDGRHNRNSACSACTACCCTPGVCNSFTRCRV